MDYIIGVLEYRGKSITDVRKLIENEKEIHFEDRNPLYASYSTYFGLGDEKSHPGINKKLGVAICGKKVQTFVYTTPSAVSGFGVGTAPAAMDGIETENTVSTPAPKTSTLSASVLTSSLLHGTNKKNNIKEAVRSAIRFGRTPIKSDVKGVSKTLDYGEDLPSEIGGEATRNENDAKGLLYRVEDELSHISFSVGTTGDAVEKDSFRIMEEIHGDSTAIMKALLGLCSTEMHVTMAKAMGSHFSEMIVNDKCSENLKHIVQLIANQESLCADTTERAVSAKAILQSNLNIVPSTVIVNIEVAENTMNEELKNAKLVFDETVAKAKLVLESTESAANKKFDDFKAKARTGAKGVKQELEESLANANSEVDRIKQCTLVDLLKPRAVVKAVHLGHEMLSYYCEGNEAATAKADVIYEQLTVHMQPAIEANNQDDMLREIINWHPNDIMNL